MKKTGKILLAFILIIISAISFAACNPGGSGATEPEKFIVSFLSNGGSSVDPQEVEDGEKATKPQDPTKADRVFDGWYSDAGLSALFDFNTAITADLTLYAKWKRDSSQPFSVVGKYVAVQSWNNVTIIELKADLSFTTTLVEIDVEELLFEGTYEANENSVTLFYELESEEIQTICVLEDDVLIVEIAGQTLRFILDGEVPDRPRTLIKTEFYIAINNNLVSSLPFFTDYFETGSKITTPNIAEHRPFGHEFASWHNAFVGTPINIIDFASYTIADDLPPNHTLRFYAHFAPFNDGITFAIRLEVSQNDTKYLGPSPGFTPTLVLASKREVVFPELGISPAYASTHEFKCWNTKADGSGISYYANEPYDLDDTFQNHTTLYAIFGIKES